MYNRLFKNFIWLSVGTILGVIIALMIISGSSSLNQFYDGGQVCDILKAYRVGDAVGMRYDTAEGRFIIVDENAYKRFSLYDEERVWDYIIIELSKMDRTNIDAMIEYYNKSGQGVCTKEVQLTEGKNVIWAEGNAYVGINIRMYYQTGATLSFDKVQFREKKIDFTYEQFLLIWAAVMLVYIGVTLVLHKVCKKLRFGEFDWYITVSFLQGVYLIAGEYLGKRMVWINKRNKSRMRTGLFLFMILYMQAVMDLHLYENSQYYKLHMLVCSLIVIAIAALCYEGRLMRLNWRNILVWAWVVLWLVACISDFFVAKRYSFLGYIMLLAVGFFSFMWGNMDEKDIIFREFISAIIISFIVTTVFCFLCRPLTEGLRYPGVYYSPGMYGMYLLFVWIALLGDIDFRIGKEKLSLLVIPEAAGIVLAGLLLWKTQTSAGIIPAFLTAAVLGFKHFFLSNSVKEKKRILLVIVLALIMTVPVFKVGTWGLMHLPKILGTVYVMEEDAIFPVSQTLFEPIRVYAAENNQQRKSKLSDSRIFKKFFAEQTVEDFTSSRNLYWAGYLREMNILGHSNKVKLWGAQRWPHNGFIAMMYRYGVFAVIPYTVMVIVNLVTAWRYMLSHKNQYGYFFFADMLAAFVLVLMENLELPFLFLCWMGMYLMMGMNFACEESGRALMPEQYME